MIIKTSFPICFRSIPQFSQLSKQLKYVIFIPKTVNTITLLLNLNFSPLNIVIALVNVYFCEQKLSLTKKFLVLGSAQHCEPVPNSG